MEQMRSSAQAEQLWSDEPILREVAPVPPIDISQNRIGLDIPLELRIANLPPTEIGADWSNVATLTEALDANERRVFRMIKELGIEPEMRHIDGLDVSMYPPYTLPVLQEEFVWRDTFRALPAYLRISHVAELLGRSVGDTRKRINNSGFEARTFRPKDREPYDAYPKRMLRAFKQEDMSVPPSHDWLSVGQLTTYSGNDRTWILNRLKELDIHPQVRRSVLTGRAIDHYPPESFHSLQMAAAERAKPGGTWLTASAVEGILGRSRSWTIRRLQQYEELAEWRQDDMGQTRKHYPPSLLEQLRQESENQRKLDQKGRNLSLTEVARALGHASAWATNRLDALGIEPQKTVNALGTTYESYSPEVLDALRSYDELHPKEKIVPDVTELAFAVGSLRSRISAEQKLLQAQRVLGTLANIEQSHSIEENLKRLRAELKGARAHYYKARDRQAR